jgi:hypothetical protein
MAAVVITQDEKIEEALNEALGHKACLRRYCHRQ